MLRLSVTVHMASNRLNIIVTYPMDTCIPTIKSDIKTECLAEVLENFLSSQMGKGADDTPRAELEVYRIHLQLDLEDDTFYTDHDCVNKGLRDGILLDTFTKIERGNFKIEEF